MTMHYHIYYAHVDNLLGVIMNLNGAQSISLQCLMLAAILWLVSTQDPTALLYL